MPINPPPNHRRPPPPPAPPPVRRQAPTLWRTTCEGCGAPLQRLQHQCLYCLRLTGVAWPDPPRERQFIDVTTIEDWTQGRRRAIDGETGEEIVS